MNRFVTIAALTAGICGTASAMDIPSGMGPGNWEMVSNAWGGTWVTQSSADVLELNYNFNGSSDPFHGTVTTQFTNVAPMSGYTTFDITWTGSHSWNYATGFLALYAEGPDGTEYYELHNAFLDGGAFSFSIPAGITLHQGYLWGLTVGGSHGDSAHLLYGTVQLSNFVPAPGALSLAGMGALVATRRRRR